MDNNIKLVTNSALLWVNLLVLVAIFVALIYLIKYYRTRLRGQALLLKSLQDDSNAFRYLIETAHEGIAVVQDTKLAYINPRMCQMSGYNEKELLALASFLPLIHPSARDAMLANYKRRLAGEKAPQRYESLFLRKNGNSYPIEISGVSIVWQGRSATLNMLTDISYRKSLEKKMQQLAHHDSLTGLLNRTALNECLEQAVAQAKEKNTSFTLLFFDLNKFKEVNDTYGHGVGDSLLQQVTERLKPLFRDSDTFARLGGDEFVVLLTQVNNKQNLEQSMERINAAMQPPFHIQGHEITSHLSQGAATFPEDGTTAKDLLSHADKNMYANKRTYYESH
ncbi:sensor domain-containing diguanylate cyclase [Marinospirillum insulare]|uniref:PAS domain S-box-containing protein/diguanylate cyclase (GGDEF) domain-containing protein n=1 Tax=Marinospirillum insulare TaxID=217169 RepID=A0ABQ6A131_9GAMM|nr:sensor domain-containing diguanylate cyclase [Marinospirillum insulare]GLR63963.1 hypothetical protein GCM10007878_14010 [Marinospirillum insulare]